MKNVTGGALALAAGAFALTADMSVGGAQELPKTMAWTAYDVGSAGYNQAVAVGSALKNHLGVTLRVLPGKNDVSRLVPLRDKKVDFSAFGIGGYQALEGAFTFGQKEWGPQAIRLLSMSNSGSCNTLIMAGDTGMKSYADLKGKRLAQIKGSPAINNLTYAYLRFADLEWSDVKVVEFGGYGASMDAVVENQIDGAITNTASGFATKISAGPRGHMYLPAPHDDEAGWARMKKVAPWFYPKMCSEAPGLDAPFEAADYPYPILITYDWQQPDMVYAMTKAMFDLYPEYKDSAPGASGWGLEQQVMEWVVPYHEGAIRYYKEIGKWSPELQKHSDELLARDTLLRETWDAYVASAGEGDEFQKGWMKARADALQKAGLNPVWETW